MGVNAFEIFENFKPKDPKDTKNEPKQEDPKIPMTLTETISKVKVIFEFLEYSLGPRCRKINKIKLNFWRS